MYDYLIVGAGLFGSTFARQAAEDGKTCLVIDKRDHIAGNCHTPIVSRIPVHKYGPHIFNTNSKKVWDYVNRFVRFNHFVNRPKAFYQGSLYSLPINLMTIQQVWPGVITPQQAEEKIKNDIIPCGDPRNFEELALSTIGKELYERFFYGYTKKQWNKEPKDIGADIFKRLPIRYTYDDNYYTKKYQGVPTMGYTQMVSRMLKHPNISVLLNTPFEKDLRSQAKYLVYTGSLDEYFDYKFGPLEYRSLRFEEEIREGNHQGSAIINYPEESVEFTRKIEHKHFYFRDFKKTVITTEYPDSWEVGKERYYPINNEVNNEIYNKYKSLAQKEKILFGGRLGNYKYWNMDQTIGAAMSLYNKQK